MGANCLSIRKVVNGIMLSVIIPVYNEEMIIGRCLGSLLKQEGVDFEIIVVDDSSTDHTYSIVAEKQKRYKKIRLFKQKHLGSGSARNLGAKKAKGDILVFVDADMTFAKDFLFDLTKPIRDGLSRGTFTKNEYVANWNNIWARCWNYNQGIKTNKRIPDTYPNQAPVFRAILKSEFEKVNGFDPVGYTDDWSLSRKLGYQATLAFGAKCFHENPSSLNEIFSQAKWIGKNEFVVFGFKKYFNLLRYSLPISFLIGVIKSIIYYQPTFIIFKLVYDFGIFLSIIKFFLNEKNLYK